MGQIDSLSSDCSNHVYEDQV